MVVYRDIISGDEILNDDFSLEQDGPVLITCACHKVTKTPSNIKDIASDEGYNDSITVYDIEETFNLVRHKPEKADFKAHLNSYLKAVARQVAADGASRETLREFQSGQGPAIKKIMDNWESFDVFLTPSMDVHAMFVLIRCREDGSPYATFWKHGLEKVET
ncbi:TCTP family protein [Penicillium sp. IBT 18751x]|nr:TCTP family protein [Penicillium sp. IBT 18751x]